MSERNEHNEHNQNVEYDQNAQSVTGESNQRRDLTDEERERRRQEHNEGVYHGGVQQIGDFDREQQVEEREAREEELQAGAYLNANDPALPTVGEDALGEVDDDDRPADEIREKQGDNPGAQG